MNVVDSSAWLEYFADEPNARFFAPAIEESRTQDSDFEDLPMVRYRAKRKTRSTS